MKTVAIIVAGGSGKRFGGEIPKQFYPVHGKPLLSWTISRFERAGEIDEIAVVVPEELLLYAREKVTAPFGFKKVTHIIAGGETRQESVKKGLDRIPFATDYVAVHDGVRPVISPEDIDNTIKLAKAERAAILARAVSDTVKRVERDYIISTLDRTRLFLAETPQVFQYDILRSAHEQKTLKEPAPDDSALVEALGFKVKILTAASPNVKVTTPDDIEYVRQILDKDDETGF